MRRIGSRYYLGPQAAGGFMRLTQNSHDAALKPEPSGGLSHAETLVKFEDDEEASQRELSPGKSV